MIFWTRTSFCAISWSHQRRRSERWPTSRVGSLRRWNAARKKSRPLKLSSMRSPKFLLPEPTTIFRLRKSRLGCAQCFDSPGFACLVAKSAFTCGRSTCGRAIPDSASPTRSSRRRSSNNLSRWRRSIPTLTLSRRSPVGLLSKPNQESKKTLKDLDHHKTYPK